MATLTSLIPTAEMAENLKVMPAIQTHERLRYQKRSCTVIETQRQPWQNPLSRRLALRYAVLSKLTQSRRSHAVCAYSTLPCVTLRVRVHVAFAPFAFSPIQSLVHIAPHLCACFERNFVVAAFVVFRRICRVSSISTHVVNSCARFRPRVASNPYTCNRFGGFVPFAGQKIASSQRSACANSRARQT